VKRAWRRWQAGRRLVECETCGRQVRRSRAVILTATFADDEWSGAGTAITATFCQRHVPQ